MDSVELLDMLHDRLLYDDGVENVRIEPDRIIVIFDNGQRFAVSAAEL